MTRFGLLLLCASCVSTSYEMSPLASGPIARDLVIGEGVSYTSVDEDAVITALGRDEIDVTISGGHEVACPALFATSTFCFLADGTSSVALSVSGPYGVVTANRIVAPGPFTLHARYRKDSSALDAISGLVGSTVLVAWQLRDAANHSVAGDPGDVVGSGAATAMPASGRTAIAFTATGDGTIATAHSSITPFAIHVVDPSSIAALALTDSFGNHYDVDTPMQLFGDFPWPVHPLGLAADGTPLLGTVDVTATAGPGITVVRGTDTFIDPAEPAIVVTSLLPASDPESRSSVDIAFRSLTARIPVTIDPWAR
jgi:hypothetical protein